MKSLVLSLSTLTLALLLTPPVFADGHLFAGASIGSAELDEDFDGFAVTADSTAVRVFVGWQFNDYFALEGGYQNFGDFEQRLDIGDSSVDVSLSADGFTLGMAATAPLGRGFSALARAGLFFWDGNAQINAVTQASPEDTNAWFSLGAGYAITGKLGARLDWTRYELEQANSTVFAVGLTYRF